LRNFSLSIDRCALYVCALKKKKKVARAFFRLARRTSRAEERASWRRRSPANRLAIITPRHVRRSLVRLRYVAFARVRENWLQSDKTRRETFTETSGNSICGESIYLTLIVAKGGCDTPCASLPIINIKG